MIRRSKRNYVIAMFLVSGFTPWGRDLPWGDPPTLTLCARGRSGRGWIMCCGHVLSRAEGDQWIAEGLAKEGEPDERGRRRLIAGPNIEPWISACWHGLQVKSWGRSQPDAAGSGAVS